MLDRLKAWNDRQRAAARERLAGNEATLRAQLTPPDTAPKPQQRIVDDQGRTMREAAAEAWGSRPDDARAWVKANKRLKIAEFAGVHVFADRIVRLNAWPLPGGEVQPISGVEAGVDASGGVSGRATLTRTAIPGAHGWQKKIDTREMWLTVDGPGFQWAVQVPQPLAGQARPFAATVTSVGRQAAAPSPG